MHCLNPPGSFNQLPSWLKMAPPNMAPKKTLKTSQKKKRVEMRRSKALREMCCPSHCRHRATKNQYADSVFAQCAQAGISQPAHCRHKAGKVQGFRLQLAQENMLPQALQPRPASKGTTLLRGMQTLCSAGVGQSQVKGAAPLLVGPECLCLCCGASQRWAHC